MEIIKKASLFYFAMLEEEEKSGKYPPYKARGMGYIRFAKEEKNLFRLLFMDKRSSDVKFPTDDTTKECHLQKIRLQECTLCYGSLSMGLLHSS